MTFLGERSFGIGVDPLVTPSETVHFAKTVEGLGFDSYWIADSPLLWREAHVLMARAAAVTSRIVIGSGVTNPVTRHPSVIAGMYATMDELTPGRIAIGIGRGDSAVLLAGLEPSTTGGLEHSILQLRDLLAGHAVPMGRIEARMSFPRRVPVFVSATGPRTLRMAARVADGAILGFLTEPAQIAAARMEIEDEAAKCGRDLTDFRYIGWIWCSVDDELDAARRRVRVHVARHLMHQTAIPEELPAELLERVRESYRYSDHMHPDAKHAEVVPLEMVDRFALVGDPVSMRERVADVLEAGLNHLVLIPGGDQTAVVETATRLATEVLPSLRIGRPE